MAGLTPANFIAKIKEMDIRERKKIRLDRRHYGVNPKQPRIKPTTSGKRIGTFHEHTVKNGGEYSTRFDEEHCSNPNTISR